MSLPLPDPRALAKELCDLAVDVVAGAVTREELAQRLLRIAEIAVVVDPAVDAAEKEKIG